MKIDVSDIIKAEGASLDIKLEGPLEDLNSVGIDFKFDDSINFDGQIINISGILKLDGKLRVRYTTLCFRCLKEISGQMDININESFVTADKADDIEAYAYESNLVEIDKVLVDNIVLSLPMKQICEDTCKGLCQKCGSNLNDEVCNCKEDYTNSSMEALKNYFKN